MREERKCSLPFCDRKHYAKGYCHSHWTYWKAGKELKPLRTWNEIPTDAPGRVCQTCKTFKSVEHFYIYRNGKMFYRCKECHSKARKVSQEAQNGA